MIYTRFFVTAVLILGMAGFTACITKKIDKRDIQVKEGNRQIKAARAAQAELGAKYKVALNSGLAESFSWNRLSKDERQSAKEKLAEFVAAVTRTLEIDSKKGVYVDKKESLQRQLDSAMTYQKSLEKFEQVYGENFEPKNHKDRQLFARSGKA